MVVSRLRILAAAALVALAVLVPAKAAHPSLGGAGNGRLVGQRFSYTVRVGDSLTLISSRFGTDLGWLAELNGFQATARLQPGQGLVVDSRHIVPPYSGRSIAINIPQRMLFHWAEDGELRAYPVGLGRPSWPTFVGAFTVASLETDPVWDVPASIQAEMARAGKPVLTHVRPGPQNPLGAYWIGLSRPGYGVHGTNAPASIYRFQTHGCIRLHPDDIASLFRAVRVGDAGETAYEPVLMTRADDGRIWLEVHPDVYRRAPEPLGVAREIAFRDQLDADIDWQIVSEAVRARRGVPVEVSLAVGLRRTSRGAAGDSAPARPRRP